jgi:hypothetical protein
MDGNGIGTLNEAPLHAALKAWYARPDHPTEVVVEGYVVDVVRDDLLVEVQTGNFSGIREKLDVLSEEHIVRLVYPIAAQKWLLKLPREGEGAPTRRKSPKRGRVEELFYELVSISHLIGRPTLSVEVALIHEEEVRRYVGPQAWRRHGWVVEERRLLEVVERLLFATPGDLGALLPADLPHPFTTAHLAKALGIRRRLAQKMAYCLWKAGALGRVGRKGRAYLYAIQGGSGS